MRLLSLNVGLPQEVAYLAGTVPTGIFKAAVAGPVRMGFLNLEGDGQADLEHHGGPDKAVYVYPSEHYAFWREQLPGQELPWGAFGENLTTEGLLESEACLGDRFRVGEAEVMVVQPRIPCFKLGIRLNNPGVVKSFLRSGRSGIYLRVMREGVVQAGDALEWTHREPDGIPLCELNRLFARDTEDADGMERLLQSPRLLPFWRGYFTRQLARLRG